MRVFRRVAVTVVMTMVTGPPQGTFLSGRHRRKRNHKLKPTRSLVGLMGKVAMIASRDPKHSEEIKKGAQNPIKPGGPGEDRRQWQEVNNNETDLRLQRRFFSFFKDNSNFHFFILNSNSILPLNKKMNVYFRQEEAQR